MASDSDTPSASDIQAWTENVRAVRDYFLVRGLNLYVTFLTTLLLRAQFSDALVMMLVVFGYMVSAGPEIFTGYYADYAKRKQSMVLGTVLAAASMLVYAMVGLGPYWTSVVLAFLGAFLLNLGQSFMIGADSALMDDSLELLKAAHKAEQEDSRSRGFYAMAEGAVSLVLALLIALNDLLGRWFEWLDTTGATFARLVMIGQAVCFVAAAFVTRRMTETPRKKRTVTLRGILKKSVKDQKIRALICLSAAAGSISAALVWLTPLYFAAYSGLQIGSGHLGWVYNVIWGAYLGSVMMYEKLGVRGRIRNLRYMGFVHLVVGAILCYAGVALANIMVGMAAIAFTYFVRSMLIPMANALLYRAVTPEEKATMISISRTLLWAMTTFSYLVGFGVMALGGSLRAAIGVVGVIIMTFVTLAVAWAIRTGALPKIAPPEVPA